MFFERAKTQVEQDHTFSDDVQAEIAARIYFLREGNASCDIRKDWGFTTIQYQSYCSTVMTATHRVMSHQELALREFNLSR